MINFVCCHLLGFSGADLAALVREAGLAVVKEWRKSNQLSSFNSTNNHTINNNSKSNSMIDKKEEIVMSSVICARHFEAAFSQVRSSVSLQDRLR